MSEEKVSTPPICNFCKKPLYNRFVDMALLTDNVLKTVEKSQHIIHTYVCKHCFLIQSDGCISSKHIDKEYITSFSPIWLHTMQENVSGIFEKIELTSDGFTVELIDHGVNTLQDSNRPVVTLTKKDVYAFIELYGKSDRIICHNEMAYAQDIDDFVAAIKLLLTPEGTLTIEFPHLLGMMEGINSANLVIDTFRYFSFTFIDIIFKHHKLTIYDAEDCLPEGCIKISAKHQENVSLHISRNTPALRGRERDKGMSSLTYYLNFKAKMERQVKSYERL